MKTCPYCGNQNSDDSLFCTECGKSFPLGDVCPHCGASVNDDDVFCNNCGNPLSQSDIINDNVVIKEAEPHSSNYSAAKYAVIGVIVLLLICVGLYSYRIMSNNPQVLSTDSIKEVIDAPVQDDTSEEDIKLIREWYGFVLNGSPTESDMTKYLSTVIMDKLWEADFEESYSFWMFRTQAQDGNPDCDENKLINIKKDGDGWYTITYKDMGWDGLTKVKVNKGKIVEFIPDKTWDGVISEEITDVVDKNDFDWLQGHWVYDIDLSTDRHNRIHVVIEGNRITQYRNNPSESTNPTFVIEDGEIQTQYEAGVITTYPIDPVKRAIVVEKGRKWMYKLGSDEEIRHRVGFEDENVFFIKIANQVFRNQEGKEIRFDNSRKVFFDEVYAGTLSIVKLEKVKAIVSYSGGECGEGKFEIHCDLMTRNFLQIIAHNGFYHQIIK